MADRPYVSHLTRDLERVFESNLNDKKVLNELKKELSFSSRPKAMKLREKINNRLLQIEIIEKRKNNSIYVDNESQETHKNFNDQRMEFKSEYKKSEDKNKNSSKNRPVRDIFIILLIIFAIFSLFYGAKKGAAFTIAFIITPLSLLFSGLSIAYLVNKIGKNQFSDTFCYGCGLAASIPLGSLLAQFLLSIIDYLFPNIFS